MEFNQSVRSESFTGDIENTLNCPKHIVEHFEKVYPVKQWKEKGLFEEKDLLDIPCHWMGFEPAGPSVHFLFAFIFINIFLVGFFTNSLVIYIMSRLFQFDIVLYRCIEGFKTTFDILKTSGKRPLTPTNILLTNSAVSDLLTVLVVKSVLIQCFFIFLNK